MAKRILKVLGVIAIGLAAVVAVVAGAVFITSGSRLNRAYTITPDKLAVSIPTDADSIARGKLIATTLGDCTNCHGKDFAGGEVPVDPALGVFNAANLTPGQGGVGKTYGAEDFVRVIRYGVKKNGRSVLVMPSEEFANLDDQDLGAMVAFLKSLPPVDKEIPPASVTLLGRALLVAGLVPAPAAEIIDPNAPRFEGIPHIQGVEYGAYLASVGCGGCHSAPGYTGGTIAGAPPDWPPAPNLTPVGALAAWSEQDFINAMRTGKTPDGRQLRSEYMPYTQAGQLPDVELKSLYAYFRSLPPAQALH
jgi:mono/diheme cytochrome c family protein